MPLPTPRPGPPHAVAVLPRPHRRLRPADRRRAAAARLPRRERGRAPRRSRHRAAVTTQLPLLIPLLADEDAAVRQAASRPVGHTGDTGIALPAVRTRLTAETEPVVRAELLTAYSRLDRAGAVAESLALLGPDTPAPLRLAALFAALGPQEPWLASPHDAALGLLPAHATAATGYAEEHWEPLSAIVELLLRRDTDADRDSALTLLDTALRDKRPDVRAEALWAADRACMLSRSAPQTADPRHRPTRRRPHGRPATGQDRPGRRRGRAPPRRTRRATGRRGVRPGPPHSSWWHLRPSPRCQPGLSAEARTPCSAPPGPPPRPMCLSRSTRNCSPRSALAWPPRRWRDPRDARTAVARRTPTTTTPPGWSTCSGCGAPGRPGAARTLRHPASVPLRCHRHRLRRRRPWAGAARAGRHSPAGRRRQAARGPGTARTDQ